MSVQLEPEYALRGTLIWYGSWIFNVWAKTAGKIIISILGIVFYLTGKIATDMLIEYITFITPNHFPNSQQIIVAIITFACWVFFTYELFGIAITVEFVYAGWYAIRILFDISSDKSVQKKINIQYVT